MVGRPVFGVGRPTRQSIAPGCAEGYAFSELLFVIGVVTLVCAMVVPQLLAGLDRSRGLVAARYLASRVALARMQAISRSATIALRFREEPGGIAFDIYQDGNRNGVRAGDILQQIDVPIEPVTRLWELFPGAAIALAPDSPAASAVQLAGGSDLLALTPMGTATSGTVHVRGPDDTQWAVRVLGATARTRLLWFDSRARQWRTQF
jgi:hypothetical protein